MIRKYNKSFKIKELIAYCIIGYRRYYPKKNETKKDKLRYIVKNVLDVSNEVENAPELINKELLESIDINWRFNTDDLLAYATNTFYMLIANETNITEQKIVERLKKELKDNHPRDVVKYANSSLDDLFLNS
ncbi:MAG: hypothetical protein IJH76_03350 [Clostridia bacterium]|nr:hypothetical protein [Clostridia bacterium]